MADIKLNQDKTVFMPIRSSKAESNRQHFQAQAEDDRTQFDFSRKPKPKKVEESTALAPSLGVKDENVLQASPSTQFVHFAYRSALSAKTLSGPNRLLQFASEVMVIHHHLLHGGYQHQSEQLLADLHEAFVQFDLRCQQGGIAKSIVKSAKYVLCAFIDETVMTRSWARETHWSQHTILSQYFNETWGGETVFRIRQYCLENLGETLPLFELITVCLCLGYQGQYAMVEKGELALVRLKQESLQIIRQARDDESLWSLAPHWQPPAVEKQTLKQFHLFGWIAGLCLALLLAVYLGLSYFMNESSVPVVAQIQQAKEALQISPRVVPATSGVQADVAT